MKQERYCRSREKEESARLISKGVDLYERDREKREEIAQFERSLVRFNNQRLLRALGANDCEIFPILEHGGSCNYVRREEGVPHFDDGPLHFLDVPHNAVWH